MFGFKLFGVALSALLTVTPVNRYGTIKYPFTRTDSFFYRVTYDVDDLGEYDPVGISGVHDYVVNYTIHVYCSSACTYGVSPNATANNINDNTIEIYYISRQSHKSPDDLITYLGGTSTSATLSQEFTYTSQSSRNFVRFSPTLGDNTLTISIIFFAETNQSILGDIASHVNDMENWIFVKNILDDDDVPSSYKQTIKNYIDNGDYSSAYNYATNYYINNSVTNSEQNETVVNNYETKQTDLNTYFNTENNFATQVETDFTNQNQDIPLSNTHLDFTNLYFTKSAEWVTLRFNDLFDTSPYGKLLAFSLITGFILALIGRFKR